MEHFVKKPCKHCPFRSDIKPFLHPERAADLAYSAQNPYSSFPCHKTTEYNEDTEDMEVIESSKECAGFLTLRAQMTGEIEDGFEPSYDICYEDDWAMIAAYEEAWKK